MVLCFCSASFARLCAARTFTTAERHLMHCECNAAVGEGWIASKAYGSAGVVLWTSVRVPVKSYVAYCCTATCKRSVL